MMRALYTAGDWISGVNEWIGRAVAWLTIPMVVIYTLVVALRYAFDYGSIGLQESVTYLHAMVFMLAAASALYQDSHVRVDIFYRKWGQRRQALVNLIGSLVFLLPLSVFLFLAGFGYVSDSWVRGETSVEPGGLPFVYLLKTLILVMAVQLGLQALAQAVDALRRLRDESPDN